MIVRSWRRLPAVGPSGPRRGRRFPWARMLLLAAVTAAVAYVFLPRYFNVMADGLIEGDLVPVAPIFRARVDRSMVDCSSAVTRGQPVATVSNFLLEQQYAADSQKLQDAARDARVSDVESVAQAKVELETERMQAASAAVDADKKRSIYEAYERSYRAGAVGKMSWESARFDWEGARAQIRGDDAIIAQTQERIARLADADRQRIGSLETEATQASGFGSRVHAQTLYAPVSGSIVDCAARPEAVVEAGTPLYHIFSNRRAYVLAFFDPKSVVDIRVGQRADVQIAGTSRPLDGRITAIYPTLAALPDALQRYFWQHVQWSEYRPVKITFGDVPPGLRGDLVYDAQVKVAVPQHRAGPVFSLGPLGRWL